MALATVAYDESPGPDLPLRRGLELVLEQTSMDAAFVSRFVGDDREVVMAAGGDGVEQLVGRVDPRHLSYCGLIADGHVGEVVADVRRHPVLRALDATATLGIGAYMGVPILDATGSAFGTVCAYAREPRPELDDADADGLRLLAAAAAESLRLDCSWGLRRDRAATDVAELVASDRLVAHGQPIVDLRRGTAVGFEALLRIDGDDRGPGFWFEHAELGEATMELELAALDAATRLRSQTDPRQWMTVNVETESLASPVVLARLERLAGQRVLVEITERGGEESPALQPAVDHLRDLGLGIAIDDAGAGHATLERLVALEPDVIKLAQTIVSGSDGSRRQQTLLRTLVSLADDFGASVIAEGIETPAELSTLRWLGVRFGQGFLLGRPGPTPDRDHPADTPVPAVVPDPDAPSTPLV